MTNTVAAMGHQPAISTKPRRPAAALGSSVPPLAVVPLGRVPLRRMVLVPLTSATLTRLWLSWA